MKYFKAMSNVYGIQPGIEHYGCMVDLLGRVGRIAEAEELIQNMPMEADHFTLGGLLGACRTEKSAQQLLKLDPNDAGT